MEDERKIALHAVFSFVIVLVILGISAGVTTFLVINKRKASEAPRERILPMVEVVALELRDYPVSIETQGVVESRRETALAAEISGRVAEVSANLKRGGVVTEGEVLVRIDPADYRSVLARAEAAVAEAVLLLAQEEARYEQARLDWEKLGRGAGSPLVLREPQLEAARAQEVSARSDVERARRDVERTEISAPFDASIRQATVEVGAVVGPGQMVAEIYSSSDLEIRLALPLEDFGFLQRAADGSPAGEITLRGSIGGERYEWPAEPVRLDQEIDRRTLSGHIIARVMPQPGSPYPLPPVGLFVDAGIVGTTLREVVEVPRRALMEGGRVLVVDGENRIAFRDVRVVRSTRDTVIVGEGLAGGERIALTRVSAPISGMEVRLSEAEAAATFTGDTPR